MDWMIAVAWLLWLQRRLRHEPHPIFHALRPMVLVARMPGLNWFRHWMVWAVAVVALSLLLALQTVRLADERAAHAKSNGDHSDYVAQLERQARDAVLAARAEELRRTVAVQEIADETQKKLDVALADADAARAAGERLRQRIAQLTASIGRGGSGGTSASAPGAPAKGTADLLADVQRRLGEAAERIVKFADESHVSGLACEASYDALRK